MRELLSRLSIGAALLSVVVAAPAAVESFTPLEMAEKHSTVSRNVTKLIEELHYSRPRIDNSISSAILDRYLDMLDGNRMYFTASDIASFSRYRYELDDRVRTGELEPAFEIFNLFVKRTGERIEQAIEMLATEPDFTIDEEYLFDRSDLPWPSSEAELAEVWRQKVKFDGLSLVLAGKTWPEAAELLADRYERLYKRVTQLTSDDVFETFMNAVAHNMDPHSSYLSPRQSEEYRITMSLSYDGIGASLQLEDDYVKVVNIIPGGPAQVDGQLKPEDRITAVGEGTYGPLTDVIGWRIAAVVVLLRGPGGPTVRLPVLPAGSTPGSPEKIISLRRDKVKLEEQAAKRELLEVPFEGETYRIGVIKVPSFYQDFAARSRGDEDYTSTSRDVARLLEEFKQEGIDGLVIDLRQNGGGHLSEATELSGLFIDKGPVVQLKETRGIQVLEDPSPTALYDGPLAVLVDRYSASASEIFAAAIQDYGRGIVIGQQTFGKGSVQNLFNLDRVMRGTGNGQLTLTIGKYYRVTGESTQHRGVIPDIELPSPVPIDTVGESTRETALPWDRIQPTDFRARPALGAELELLRTHQASRAEKDPNFAYLLSDIAAIEEARSAKTVSLNLEKRKAERERAEREQLARENARREALGLEPLNGIEELDAVQRVETILLEQAAQILAEMVALHQTPSGTRQLLSGSEGRQRN